MGEEREKNATINVPLFMCALSACVWGVGGDGEDSVLLSFFCYYCSIAGGTSTCVSYTLPIHYNRPTKIIE